jgi:hypothetical protein
MLALQKTLDSSWEIARVSLRQDLDTIQTVLNRRWGQTFGAANVCSRRRLFQAQGCVITSQRY